MAPVWKVNHFVAAHCLTNNCAVSKHRLLFAVIEDKFCCAVQKLNLLQHPARASVREGKGSKGLWLTVVEDEGWFGLFPTTQLVLQVPLRPPPQKLCLARQVCDC